MAFALPCLVCPVQYVKPVFHDTVYVIIALESTKLDFININKIVARVLDHLHSGV